MRSFGLRVQVSMDGATPSTNDALRGPGTFNRALGTGRELIAARMHTTLCMVACRENQAEIRPYLRLAKEHRRKWRVLSRSNAWATR